MATIPPVVPPGPAEWPADVVPTQSESRLTRGYLKWATIFMVVLAGPTAIAAILNHLGWSGVIPTMMTFLGVAYALTLPPLVGATSIVDLARRLRKPADDATEEEKALWRTTRWTAIKWATFFFGSLMGPVLLYLLPLKGFGGMANILVALVIPVVAWTIIYSEKTWIIRRFGWLLMVVFCTFILYWVMAGLFPEATRGVRLLVKNNIVGPVLHLGGRQVAQSEIDRLERKIDDTMVIREAFDVGLCLEQVYEDAERGDYDGKPKELAKAKADCKAKAELFKKTTGAEKEGGISKSGSSATKSLTSWSGDFVPSNGALSLGTFQAGSYRVVGSGTRQQAFWDGNHRQDFAMDKDGRLVNNGNRVHVMGQPATGQATIPFPNAAYGAVIAVVKSDYRWVANGQCFGVSDGEEVKLDSNVGRHPENRAGSGALKLRLERVETC